MGTDLKAERLGGAFGNRPRHAIIVELEGRPQRGTRSVCTLLVAVFEFATTPDVEAS